MFPRPEGKWQAAAAAAAVTALVAGATWQRWAWLAGDPYPVGVDGFYYAVQVRALLESGTLNYPAAPLGFWWLAPFAALLGVVPGVKLGAALGTALAVVPAYLLGRRLAGGARAPALLGATLVATSASSAFLAGEFLKQGLGLTVALFALAALAAALDAPTRARVAVAVALALAAPLVHKTSAVLVVGLGAPAVVLWLRRHRPELGRRALVGVGVLLALLAGLGALMPERFVGARDLAVLGALVDAKAHWQLPALARPGHTVLLGHDALVGAALALIVLAATLAARFAPRATPATPATPAAAAPASAPLLWAFVALALLIGLPWLAVGDPQGGAFRLRAAAFVTLGPLAAVALARAGSLLRATPALLAMAALGGAAGLAVARQELVVDGASHTHPALVQATRALDGQLPAGATLITQDRKVAFMARWYARQPTRLRPPPALDVATTYRLLPGVYVRPALRRAIDELRATRPAGVVLPRALHAFDAHGMVLVPEATFRWLVARLPDDDRAYYEAWQGT